MFDWLEHQPIVEVSLTTTHHPPIGQQPLQALTLPNLRDELFCQLMRMTENNPSMYVQPTIARNRLHGQRPQSITKHRPHFAIARPLTLLPLLPLGLSGRIASLRAQ
jgi:hypothetical protein